MWAEAGPSAGRGTEQRRKVRKRCRERRSRGGGWAEPRTEPAMWEETEDPAAPAGAGWAHAPEPRPYPRVPVRETDNEGVTDQAMWHLGT